MVKKGSKGFSIPELLAVIVIMGILISIATASYNGISKTMKEKTYNNKLQIVDKMACSKKNVSIFLNLFVNFAKS